MTTQIPGQTEREFNRLLQSERLTKEHRRIAMSMYQEDPEFGLGLLKGWLQPSVYRSVEEQSSDPFSMLYGQGE